MKKRYELTGAQKFKAIDEPDAPWIDPTGGGFIEADIEPTRERFLIEARYIKEAAPPAPAPLIRTSAQDLEE